MHSSAAAANSNIEKIENGSTKSLKLEEEEDNVILPNNTDLEANIQLFKRYKQAIDQSKNNLDFYLFDATSGASDF